MNTNQERESLKKRLQSKEHRDAFVSVSVDQTIPFQIRALRLAKERNWTQEDLASKAGMKQERISACENPNYGKFNIRTLKQLAAAFDVGLIVRFAPFSELMEWEVNMSPESLEVPSFSQQADYFKEKILENDLGADILEKNYSYNAAKQPKREHENMRDIDTQKSGVITKLSDYAHKRQSGIHDVGPGISMPKTILEGYNETAVC